MSRQPYITPAESGLCFYSSSLFNRMSSPRRRRKCFFSGCVNSMIEFGVSARVRRIQSAISGQCTATAPSLPRLLHVTTSTGTFSRFKRSSGQQPVGDWRVITALGLDLEGLTGQQIVDWAFCFSWGWEGRKGKKPWNAYWSILGDKVDIVQGPLIFP